VRRPRSGLRCGEGPLQNANDPTACVCIFNGPSSHRGPAVPAGRRTPRPPCRLRVPVSSMSRAVVKLFRVLRSVRCSSVTAAEQTAHPQQRPAQAAPAAPGSARVQSTRRHHAGPDVSRGSMTQPRLLSGTHDPRAAPRDCSVSIRTCELRYLLRGGRRSDPTRTVRTARVRRGASPRTPTPLSGSRPRGRCRSSHSARARSPVCERPRQSQSVGRVSPCQSSRDTTG
jgi:hypothetical protein